MPFPYTFTFTFDPSHHITKLVMQSKHGKQLVMQCNDKELKMTAKHGKQLELESK